MGRERVALFGPTESEQVTAMAAAFRGEGADLTVLDNRLGGSGTPRVAMDPGRMLWQGVDLSGFGAAVLRGTAPNTLPALPPLLHAASFSRWREGYLKEQSTAATTLSFFEELSRRGTLVVNRLTCGYTDHDSKGQLYPKLAAWGFPVPAALTTNDPREAAEFRRLHGEIVVKPAMGVGSTRAVEPDESLEGIAHCPVLLQQRIHGDTLRVHVVGDQAVLTLRILNEGGVDSRTGTRAFEPAALPPGEGEKIARATWKLGLHYAAWDVILNDNGPRYLDCNPGPFVMWIGTTLADGVFRRLARYVLEFSRTGEREAACRAVEPVPTGP
ncbi:MAG: ATP-grasp domain-containing protein [Magnetococcales bacterium]|nr:ATP-grasp domain-containing protein [Magnetococcales bacterium]